MGFCDVIFYVELEGVLMYVVEMNGNAGSSKTTKSMQQILRAL